MPPLSRLTNEKKPVNIELSPRHGQSSPWRGGRKLRGLFQPGFSIWKLAILRHLRPLTPRALRKPSVYAGPYGVTGLRPPEGLYVPFLPGIHSLSINQIK